LNPAVKTAGYFQIVPFGTKMPLDRKIFEAQNFIRLCAYKNSSPRTTFTIHYKIFCKKRKRIYFKL
jgi:hypothetical protein